MIVYTIEEVRAKIEKYCDNYKFYGDAAEAMGCSKQQLSGARSGALTPCPAILNAIGVERIQVYAKKEK